MWDLETGASIGKPLEGHGSHVNSVTFSPDSTKIASGSSDGTIRLWSVKTQAMIGAIHWKGDVLTSVAFSHDGAFLVSGSLMARFECGMSRQVSRFASHLGAIPVVLPVCCMRPPTVFTLVSGSEDKSVRLWDIADILARGKVGQGHDIPPNPRHFPLQIITTPTYISILISHTISSSSFPLLTLSKCRTAGFSVPDGELLLWVPPANRTDLLSPSSRSRILGVPSPTELDFSDFKCGTEWTHCREPIDTE